MNTETCFWPFVFASFLCRFSQLELPIKSHDSLYFSIPFQPRGLQPILYAADVFGTDKMMSGCCHSIFHRVYYEAREWTLVIQMNEPQPFGICKQATHLHGPNFSPQSHACRISQRLRQCFKHCKSAKNCQNRIAG